MKLSAPKQITWIIALILGVVGILANLASIPVITPVPGLWLVVVGWALLYCDHHTRLVVRQPGSCADRPGALATVARPAPQSSSSARIMGTTYQDTSS